jgi:long-chain acyl-CoA synthetase
VHRPWLAHYDYWTPATLTVPARPLTDILETTAIELPEHPATVCLGHTLTSGEIKRRSDWCAAALLGYGIAPGDRVGIMLPTCPQYIVATFAVLRAGAIVVNINPASTMRELEVIAIDAGLRALITLDTVAAVADSVRARTSIELLIVTSMTEAAGDSGRALRLSRTVPLAGLCEGQGRPPVIDSSSRPDDVAVLQYTGGTTGVPRAAMLTHRNIFANVVQTEAFTERTRTRGQARFLVVLPFFHTFGFTVAMMKGVWLGALQILIPKFNPAAVLDAVRTYSPTYFPAVPTIWASLAAHPDARSAGLDRIAICTSGGAPLPHATRERFEAVTGRRLFEGFGLTEAAPVTHSTPQLGLHKPGTVGLPMPGTDIKVVDVETGTIEMGTDIPGELCISGPQVMQGYWNRPDETARSLRRDESGRVWLYTGDIATIDGDGYTTIVQRKKDLILVDGFNVYPAEVEGVLAEHPSVRRAAVVGLPDEYHGEQVHACVVLHDGADANVDDVVAHCRGRLTAYKVPVALHVVDQLPTSAVGKVLYRVLRDQLTAAISSP